MIKIIEDEFLITFYCDLSLIRNRLKQTSKIIVSAFICLHLIIFKTTMNQGRLITLLFALLACSLVSATPLNSCPPFQIQAATISQIPTNVNFDFSITTTITLMNFQPDISYKAAVSYKCLSIPQIEKTVQIDLWVDSYNATSITIAMKAPSSGGAMQGLKIMYLIIPSVYNNDIYVFTPNACISITCTFDFALNAGNTISQVQAYPVSLTNGTYEAVGFINGLNIEASSNPNSVLGLSLSVAIINSTHYSLSLKSVSSDPILLNAYYFTLIVFRTPSTLYGIKITTLMLSFPNTIYDSSLSSTKTFFGMSQYSFQNANFQFCIGVGNNTAVKTVFANMISFKVQLISFEVGSCCLSTPWIDATNSSCTSSCPDRFYPDNTSLSCQPCFYDCYTCISSTVCISCNVTTDFRQLNSSTLRCDSIIGYFDIGITVATSCHYPKCCGYTPLVYNEGSSCLVACPDGFIANAKNVCIPCDTGYWPISGHCTNVVGCVASIVNNGSVQCIFCRVTGHFILQNQTCVCMEGYSLDTLAGKCIEVCGDGIRFSQNCDDNNTEDGDGCSSACQSEDYFLCNSNSNYLPSQCAYVSSVQITFNSAKKTEGKNQGVFSFGLSAKHAKLNVAKIISNFIFSCDPRVTTVTMSASSTEVILQVDYEEDLEEKLTTVTFNLDPKRVLSSTSLMTVFFMTSSNQKLIVIRSYQMIKTLRKVVEVIALVALIVFAIASFAYRMIAVEMLHSFLLVYFISIETSNPTEPFLVFKSLRILALNFEATGNFYSQGSILSYSFQNELKTKQILAILIIAALAALGIEKTIWEYLKNSTDKLKVNHSRILKVCRYAFRSLLFSISIGYGYQVLMPSFFFSSISQDYQVFKASIAVLILSVCLSIQFFAEFKVSTRTQRNDVNKFEILHKRCYPGLYLFFWLDIMILLVPKAVHKSDCLEEDSLVIALLLFSWFMCTRPYNSSIHNVGQGISLSIDVLFLSWSVSRKYSQQLRSESIQIDICLAILTLMSLSIITSVFRIIHIFRTTCKSFPVVQPVKKQKEDIKVDGERIEDTLQVENKYRIRSMLLSEQMLEISGVIHPNANLKWRKELLVTLKQKYKIQNKENEGSEEDNHAVPQLNIREY